MTEHDDLQIQTLFDEAATALPEAAFIDGVMQRVETQERIGRTLAVAQGLVLMGLLIPLSLFIESRLPAWTGTGRSIELLGQGSWWLAGFIIGVALLLSPAVARTA